MQSRKLSGAALTNHLAKKHGLKLMLVGAAKRSRELKELLGAAEEPMKIGDAVVIQFATETEIDGRVPWDGVPTADANFALVGEVSREPMIEDAIEQLDERLDKKPSDVNKEERRRVEIFLARLDRREVRRERKKIGRQKLLERLSRAHFAAQIALVAAQQHRDVTKQDLHRFLAGRTERKPAPKRLKADPANIPAAKKWVVENYPQRQAL